MKTSVLGLNKGYVLTLSQTIECLNLSRSTIYRLEKKGLFPKRIQLTPQKKGYFRTDLEKWLGGLK